MAKKKKTTETPVTFISDNSQLVGIMHTAGHEKALIMCHGFTGSKIENKRLYVEAARIFAEQHCDVLRFDFYGSGDSEGDFEETRVSINIQNLRDAFEFLKQKGYSQIAVLGISMGAATAILTAKDLDIQAIVLWSSVPDMQEIFKDKTSEFQKAVDNDITVIDYNGWRIHKDFMLDALAYDVRDSLKEIAIPKFILQGTADNPVFVEGFHKFRDIVIPPADFMEIPEAGHTFQTSNHRRQAIRQTLIWLMRNF